MRSGEIESLASIGAAVVSRPAGAAREVQQAVTARVFGLLGPLAMPVRPVHDGVAAACYRGVAASLGGPLRAAGTALARGRDEAASVKDSALGAVVVGALNGIAGDRLARDHPDLAFELELRRRGRAVSLDRGGLSLAYPDATSKVAVFVHGLCETEAAWTAAVPGGEPRPSYGAGLKRELGFTPVYVRYNTGVHVSDNGRRLAETLETLAAEWPREVDQMVLVGHSMGGLVARSACHYGHVGGHRWVGSVRHVFCLGTPHLGAPMEKAANVAGWALSRLPESKPFADLFFNGRSAGIKDLRYGSCVEEDWHGHDPDEFLRDRCGEVPFVPSAAYYFIGATLTRRPGGAGGLVGDLLVSYSSASGNGRRRRIPFELERGRHLGRMHHLQLLNHPAVYSQLRDWIAAGSYQPGLRALRTRL